MNATAEKPAAETAATADKPGEVKRWYAVQVLVGFEKAVRENLLGRISEHGMEDRFGEILLPIERTMEIQSGKKKVTERKLYPGYLFLEIAADAESDLMRPECWHLVSRTRRVGNFISMSGGSGAVADRDKTPAPLSAEVVEKIRRQMRDSFEKDPVVRALFAAGDHVRVKDGPFTEFSGVVDAVNSERSRLKVLVMVFGRSTPVELDFGQVDKI